MVAPPSKLGVDFESSRILGIDISFAQIGKPRLRDKGAPPRFPQL